MTSIGDVTDGTDPAIGRRQQLAVRAPGVRAGVLPDVSIPRLPPQHGWLPRTDDPVKFGASDIVSFAPTGSASPGSLYLTDGQRMTALVLNGVTGRLRLFRFDTRDLHWKELDG